MLDRRIRRVVMLPLVSTACKPESRFVRPRSREETHKERGNTARSDVALHNLVVSGPWAKPHFDAGCELHREAKHSLCI